MQGADRFANIFKTGQIKKLYLVSGVHARGRTFSIYVLPEGEEAIPNGENNPPLNKHAVCVYGVTGGQLGWTETYGWLHSGKWQEDFNKLVAKREEDISTENKKTKKEIEEKANNIAAEKSILLSNY